jgi:DNA-binding XRE family transcriptional regulator
VANHPNRNKKKLTIGDNPSPAEIRRAREDAGLTQTQAGELIHATLRAWQNYETDDSSAEHRKMHPALWELFQVKCAARKLLDHGDAYTALVRRLGLQIPPPPKTD